MTSAPNLRLGIGETSARQQRDAIEIIPENDFFVWQKYRVEPYRTHQKEYLKKSHEKSQKSPHYPSVGFQTLTIFGGMQKTSLSALKKREDPMGLVLCFP